MLIARIVEKHSLSTGASREAPVDKCARRHLPRAALPQPMYLNPGISFNLVWGPRAGIIVADQLVSPNMPLKGFLHGLLSTVTQPTHARSPGAGQGAPSQGTFQMSGVRVSD